MPLDDFFRFEEVPSDHPLLKHVENRLKDGEVAHFQLYRPREALGFRQARIFIHFSRDGQAVDYQKEDWDDDLNASLVGLGVRSRTPEEEKERFALGLRAALRKPENRFGDGFFNTALVNFIHRSVFHEHAEVSAVLAQLSGEPRRTHGDPGDCEEMILAALQRRAEELTKKLRYDVPEAADILAGAIARYLDERFSVTNRRLLKLL